MCAAQYNPSSTSVFPVTELFHDNLLSSDGDPDPYVLELPESGSFYHKAKIVRKTLIPIVLRLLYDFLSLKNDVNVPSERNKAENFLKNSFFVGVLKVKDENSRIQIRIHGSELRGMKPRIRILIRIRTKMSRIHNTVA